MEILYHTIAAIAVLAASPFILMRMALSPAFRSDILERFVSWKSLPPAPGCFWIHASSAGEVRAAKILLEALRKSGGSPPVFLSTFTRTGYELAKKENIDNVFRLPPDFLPWLIPPFNKLNPSRLILIEAELWPSLLRLCKRRKTPALLVNGRMSQKSADRYRKFPWFFRWAADAVDAFCMRTQTDANRVLALGVPPEKVRVTGNIKFDAPIGHLSRKGKKYNRNHMVAFVSTRPGDEGPIMEAVARLRRDLPHLNYLIAPRHLERRKEIESLILEYGVKFTLHSQLAPDRGDHKGKIILLDAMGELNQYYDQAVVAFVGGGFNPRFGGQNILEPAAFGLPVIFGKHMNNFEEEARLFKESGGGIQIDAPNALYSTLHRLLTHPEELDRRGRAAAETVRANQGAVRQTIELIRTTQNNK